MRNIIVVNKKLIIAGAVLAAGALVARKYTSEGELIEFPTPTNGAVDAS
jgi:hypothetical protein